MRILHTMLRVGDLDRSSDFYTNVLGMKLLRRKDYPGGKFTLAFVGYDSEDRSAVLELTYNWASTRTRWAAATATSPSRSTTPTPHATLPPRRAARCCARPVRCRTARRSLPSLRIRTVTRSSSSRRAPPAGRSPRRLTDRLGGQRHQRLRQSELAGQRESLRVLRHLAPGAADDLQPFRLVVIGFALGKRQHVVFDEHQVGDVLQQLRVRIDFDAALAHRFLDAFDHGVVIAGLAHQVAGGIGAEGIEAGAPRMVTLLGHWVTVARHRPATDVLGTYRQLRCLCCGRRKAADHLRHAAAVPQLFRLAF